MDLTRIEITFAMFSGRPNPVATVEGAAAEQLLARLAPGDPIPADQPSAWRPRLGYRGLIIHQAAGLAQSLPETFRLCGGRLLGAGLRHQTADHDVEDYLCSEQGPAGQVLSATDLAMLRAGLAAPLADEWWQPAAPAPAARERGAPRPCPGAPEPAFAQWNDALIRRIDCHLTPPRWCRQCTNNSYNYATNIRTDSLAWPGEGSGRKLPPAEISVARVRQLAFYDGLLDTPGAPFPDLCIGRGILVALAVAPGHDFTWYRKNNDGYWGHKPGTDPATDLDNKQVKIIDPRTCDRGSYTAFGGFMTVVPGRARISGLGPTATPI